jgi:hypothetical protein
MCRHACHKCSRNHNGGLIRKLTSPRKNENNSHENCICPNDQCGRSFEHPLQLTVLSRDPVKTYPACPYCMSKIETEEENQQPAKQAPIALKIKTVLQKEKEHQETKDQSEIKCQHGFGYLKNRPKGTSIPDGCLVCQKMIQCLT